MEKDFNIEVVNKFGREKQYAQLFSYIESFAKKDHPDALAIMGICYDFGYGVEQDFAHAIKCYEKSATLNSIYGQFHYGWYVFYFAKKLSMDKKTGMDLLIKSADQGCISAQYELGRIFHYKDEEKARKYYQQAAEGGDARAQRCLGNLFRLLHLRAELEYDKVHEQEITAESFDEYQKQKKENTKELYATAIKWLRKAAKQGDVDSQYILGHMIVYYDGYGESNEEGILWLEKAGENQPPHKEHNIDEFWLEDRKNDRKVIDISLKTSVPWCWLNYDRMMRIANEEAMSSNIRDARFELGLEYNGEDASKAFYWWTKLHEIDDNDKYANFYLGKSNYYGWGTDQNYTKAFDYFNRVLQIDNAYAEALLYLAFCYYYGRGTYEDHIKAFECFSKVALEKTKDGCLAKYYMGLYYYDGDGVSKNKQKALELFYEAVSIRKKDGKTEASIAKTKRFRGLDNDYFEEFDDKRLCGKACFFLGYLYEMGIDVPQDVSKACELYERGLHSSYAPTDMLAVRDMLMESDLEEKLLKQEMKWLQFSVKQAKELYQSKIEFDSIHKGQTAISNTLDKLSKELQTFVAEQKAKASVVQNPDDVDILDMSNSIGEKIDSIKQGDTHAVLQEASDILKEHFGEYWTDLDSTTRKFLITAQGLFTIMQSMKAEDLDYSGVCVTACSALENELKIRFVNGYRNFLEKNCGKSQSDVIPKTWPQFMGRNDSSGKIRDRFTLGEAEYIVQEHIEDKKIEPNVSVKILENYLTQISRDKQVLMKDIDDHVLKPAAKLKHIRNAAAHTGIVPYEKATKCYEKVLGIKESQHTVGTARGIIFELVSMTKNPDKTL